MTTPGQDLPALLGRVEAAEGPDTELDGRIWCAALGYEYVRPTTQGEAAVFRHGDREFRHEPAPLTASLDAALGLVERALPGFHVLLTSVGAPPSAGPPHAQWCVSLKGELDFTFGKFRRSLTGGNRPTPALALCLALLRALQPQELEHDQTN